MNTSAFDLPGKQYPTFSKRRPLWHWPLLAAPTVIIVLVGRIVGLLAPAQVRVVPAGVSEEFSLYATLFHLVAVLTIFLLLCIGVATAWHWKRCEPAERIGFGIVTGCVLFFVNLLLLVLFQGAGLM